MVLQHDIASPALRDRLASCAPLLALAATDGAVLPPLWHWLLFLDAAPQAALGADGHQREGGMVPHDPALPARMWAGGRLRFRRPVPLGAAVTRDSTVLQEREREGRGGRLRFVTLTHTIAGSGGVLVEEEQDLVFRAPVAGPVRAPEPAPAAPNAAVLQNILPDSVLLFRFSALTFNAHRIHYDLNYAGRVEHYPGLVVHAPLQAMLLAALLHRATEGAVLRRFAFRAQSPAFAGNLLGLEAWPDPARPGAWRMQTRDPSGAICMIAEADFLRQNRMFSHDPRR